MKILIIGERYSSNLGDPIICETVEYLLKKTNANIEISFLDLSAKTVYDDKLGTKKLIRSGRISSLKKKVSTWLTKFGIDTEYIKFKKSHEKKVGYFHNHLKEANFDIAVFAGGQIFKDTFVFAIVTIVEYLNAKNIPIVFNACGYGEITSTKMRNRLGTALRCNNIKLISSRDDIDSINMLIDDEKKEVMKTFDPALWTKEVYNVSKKESEVIGLGVMYAHNMKYKEMLEFWINTISELETRNVKWKLFCNGPVKDYEFAKHILRNMNYKEEEINRYVVDVPRRPKDLINIISNFKGIISFRLHSHIIACSLGVPGVAIVWDKKVKYFYESINMPERTFELNSDHIKVIEGLIEAIRRNYDENIIIKQKQYLKDILIENSIEKWSEYE